MCDALAHGRLRLEAVHDVVRVEHPADQRGELPGLGDGLVVTEPRGDGRDVAGVGSMPGSPTAP
jgi:hypothetical protein